MPVLLLLIGCASTEHPARLQPTSRSTLDGHGYALLYDLMGDEKNVSKIRFIKRELPELRELIIEISSRCNEAHKTLAAFGKADPSLDLKDLGLPADEVATRKAISKSKASALLHSKGKEFEVQLLLSQNEALTYGTHLSKILIPVETHPARAEFLSKLSFDLLKLQQKTLDMILANYSWPDPK